MVRSLAALKQQNSNLSQVKVDEVFGFVCNIAPKVPSHNHVPKKGEGLDGWNGAVVHRRIAIVALTGQRATNNIHSPCRAVFSVKLLLDIRRYILKKGS